MTVDEWLHHHVPRLELDLTVFDQVFDVGANEGQFAALARAAGCQVVSFEPLLKEAATIPNQVFGVGLAETAGVRTFYRNDASVCSSLKPMLDLHKQTYPFSQGEIEISCAFLTLDHFAEMVKPNCLLKVDTQGSEMEVLRGGMQTLGQFAAVLLEVSWEPLYEGTASFEELDSFLSGFGFHHAHRVDEMRHPETDVLLQSDELWKRT